MDFSYILYFKQEQWFPALLKVVSIAEPAEKSTRLVFKDQEIMIPMETWVHNQGVVHAEDRELDFCSSLYFEEDEAIREYRDRLRIPELEKRGNLAGIDSTKVPVGYIYLTIRNERSKTVSPNELENL